MRKRRNIHEEEEEDTSTGGYGHAVTIETLQSLVMVGDAWGEYPCVLLFNTHASL